MCKSEDNFGVRSFLPLHGWVPGIRLGSECLCTLIQLISLGLQALFSSPSKALCMVSFATNELKKQEETNETLWQYQKTIQRANLPSGILFYLSIYHLFFDEGSGYNS